VGPPPYDRTRIGMDKCLPDPPRTIVRESRRTSKYKWGPPPYDRTRIGMDKCLPDPPRTIVRESRRTGKYKWGPPPVRLYENRDGQGHNMVDHLVGPRVDVVRHLVLVGKAERLHFLPTQRSLSISGGVSSSSSVVVHAAAAARQGRTRVPCARARAGASSAPAPS
jgi:hypothetical protein